MHDGVPYSRSASGDGGRSGFGPSDDYYAYHDPDSSAKLSTTVVHALSEVMNVDVTDTGFTLYESVDPDALDRIFSDGADDAPGPAGHVAFSVEGYRVTVYSNGQIVITPPRSPRS